jgi:hypothetical protein
MLHPFLQNKAITFQWIAYWVILALLQSVVLLPIVDMAWWIVFIDSIIHASLLFGMSFLLWSVMQYGNYQGLPAYQRYVNFAGLGTLLLIVWLGCAYILFLLFFGAELADKFIYILPLRALLGILVYVIIIQYFNTIINKKNLSEPTDKADDEPNNDTNEEVGEPKENKEILERIAVKSGTKIQVVLVPDILYLQADGDYVQIFTANGKFLKEQTMKYFEEHLPENKFVRVHRSVIVNVESISRIELYEKQINYSHLKTGIR